MTGPSTSAELELLDAVRLWRLVPGMYMSDVIDAAAECLVAGSDTPALRELAGASPRDSRFVLDPLILTTVEELQLSNALDPEVQRSAMVALARRLKSGRITPRALASWAHTHIGHDGVADCQPFVNADDMYDVVEYAAGDEAAIDAMVHEEADALLAGTASPGLSSTSELAGQPRRDNDRRPLWLRRFVRWARRR